MRYLPLWNTATITNYQKLVSDDRDFFLLMQARRPKSRYQQVPVPPRHSGEKLFLPLQPGVDQFPQSMTVALFSLPLASAGPASPLHPSGSSLLHMKTPVMGRRAHQSLRGFHLISSYICKSPISETGHCHGHHCVLPQNQNLSISNKFKSHISCNLPGKANFTW